MKDQEIKELAFRILSPIWGPVEIGGIEVASHEDHLGEDAIYLKVVLPDFKLPLDAGKFLNGQQALREKLSASGDERFPYIEAINPDRKLGQVHLRPPAPTP